MAEREISTFWRAFAGTLGTTVILIVGFLVTVHSDVQLLKERELPPRWLIERVEGHDKHCRAEHADFRTEMRRLQRQIDRLESAHDGIGSKPLPPYTYHQLPMGGYVVENDG